MITTICLLILAFSILKRPIGWLAKKLEAVDWKTLAQNIWDKIVLYSKKGGRVAARPVLKFYYAMQEGNLSAIEKALVYAAIIYIVVPRDFLPKSVLGWFGVIDDVGAAAFVYSKVKHNITPDIENKVEDTLNDWFGPEIVTELVASIAET